MCSALVYQSYIYRGPLAECVPCGTGVSESHPYRAGDIKISCNSWVQTDIGNRAAATFGLKEAAITVDESANGVMKIIDEASLESHSGRLFKSDGTQEPW